MNFIEDKELENLNQFDLLETRKYAITLQRIIENSRNPLTIGVFGEWGSGKSSVINTVKNNVDKKIKFVIYDAWKYQGDSFRRMFLREISNQLNLKMYDNFENFYIDKNESIEKSKGINWKLIFVLLLGIFILIDLSMFKNIEIAVILTFIATIIGIIGKDIFNKYTITINHLRLFAPEQFQEIYNEMIDSIFNLSLNPIKWVKEKIDGKIEKIVIVIDNLDRCDDVTIYELLTTIKTFLQKENVIFIVPIDDLRLKKFLAEKHKLNEKELDEFLRKIFDLTLKIKTFKPLDMFHYTNELNKKYSLNLQPDTIDIFAKEYATNPRRIIQLVNNLLVEKDILKNKYNDSFVEQYESLIAKLLIIREEWPDFFKQLQEKPKLINQEFENKSKSGNDIKESELIRFLRRTKGYSINSSDSIIDKIISNIDNNHGISNEIIEKLDNFDYEKIEKKEINEKLLNYIFDELLKEIKNKTYRSGALNRFKNLININSKKELPLNFIKRFISDFNQDDIFKIIENLDREEFDDLFIFINLLHKNDFSNYLDSFIKRYSEVWKNDYNKEQIEELPKIWNDGLDYLINNIDDEEYIKLLQNPFVYFYDYYSSDSPLYDKGWINKDKLKIIISQKFIDYLIDKSDEKFENNAFNELIYFAKLELLNIKMVEEIFNKLNWTQDNNFTSQNEAKEKTISDLIKKIENLNKLLQALKPIKFKSEIIENKLKNIKTINKTYRQGYSNQSLNINLINDISIHDDNSKKLLDFYLYIYRSTYNAVNIVEYVKELVDKYQYLEKILYSSLIELHNKFNFTLKPFIDYLLFKNNIDENLLNIYLIYIENNSLLEEYREPIQNKLLNLLKEYNESIKWFFDKLIDTTILKDVLIELLENDFEKFSKLPIRIKKLAFEYICNNKKIMDFENDIEVLKEFAKTGYSDCIENILVKKLGEEKIDEVIEILNQFEVIPMNLWKNLALLKKYKEEEKYKESILKLEKKVK